MNPSMLVVEDNADQWFVIRWALQQQFPQVDPVWKSDTDQVLLYLQACTRDGLELPRLILVDLYLPLRDQGLQLVHTLKTHPRYTWGSCCKRAILYAKQRDL